MKYCSKCGKQIHDEAVFCVHCGCQVAPAQTTFTADTGNILWGVLGFFIPIAGLILYLVWKDSSPKNALQAGKGALANVIVGLIGTILSIVLSVVVPLLYMFIIGIASAFIGFML